MYVICTSVGESALGKLFIFHDTNADTRSAFLQSFSAVLGGLTATPGSKVNGGPVKPMITTS
jgi:hypothetical protein